MTADDVFSEIIYGIRYMDTDVVVMYQRLSMLGVEFSPKEKIFEFASFLEELQP